MSGSPSATAGPLVAQSGNGLRVLAARRSSVPLVQLRLQLPHARPAGAAGAATELLVAAVGTAAGPAARRLRRAGGRVKAWATAETVAVDVHVAPSGVDTALECLSEIALAAPAPAPGVRDALVPRLRLAASDPGTTAATALYRMRFPDHPGLEPASPEALATVTAHDVNAAHERAFQPRGADLVVVGDVDPDGVPERAEAALGRWPDRGRCRPLRLPAPVERPDGIRLDAPGTTLVRLATAAPAPDDPAAAAFGLATQVLGGSFGSRLVHRLRHREGRAYAVTGGADAVRAARSLLVDAHVAPGEADAVLDAVREEVLRLARSGPGPDELADARRYAAGMSVVAASTQLGLLERIARSADLGPDWTRRRADALAAVTVDDVRVAAEGMAATEWTPVVIGPGEGPRVEGEPA